MTTIKQIENKLKNNSSYLIRYFDKGKILRYKVINMKTKNITYFNTKEELKKWKQKN